MSLWLVLTTSNNPIHKRATTRPELIPTLAAPPQARGPPTTYTFSPVQNTSHKGQQPANMSQPMAPPPPPPQWVIDLNSPPISKPKSSSIPDPPGFTGAPTSGSKVSLAHPRAQLPSQESHLMCTRSNKPAQLRMRANLLRRKKQTRLS